MINYAHRGASEYAPENTLSSFYLGLLQGANGIETDGKAIDMLLSIGGEEIVPMAKITEELIKEWRSKGFGVRAWVFKACRPGRKCVHLRLTA